MEIIISTICVILGAGILFVIGNILVTEFHKVKDDVEELKTKLLIAEGKIRDLVK